MKRERLFWSFSWSMLWCCSLVFGTTLGETVDEAHRILSRAKDHLDHHQGPGLRGIHRDGQQQTAAVSDDDYYYFLLGNTAQRPQSAENQNHQRQFKEDLEGSFEGEFQNSGLEKERTIRHLDLSDETTSTDYFSLISPGTQSEIDSPHWPSQEPGIHASDLPSSSSIFPSVSISPPASSFPSASRSPSNLPSIAPPTATLSWSPTSGTSFSATPSASRDSSNPSSNGTVDKTFDWKTCTASEMASFLLYQRFNGDAANADVFLRQSVDSLAENNFVTTTSPSEVPTESNSINQNPSQSSSSNESSVPTKVTSTSTSPSTGYGQVTQTVEPSMNLQPTNEASSAFPSSSQFPTTSSLPSSHAPSLPYASESPNPTALASESIEPSTSLPPSREPSSSPSQSQIPTTVTKTSSQIPTSLLPSESSTPSTHESAAPSNSRSNSPSYQESTAPSFSSEPSKHPSLAPQTSAPSNAPSIALSSEPSASIEPSFSPTFSCPKHVQAKHKQKHEKWITYKTLTLDCLGQEFGEPVQPELAFNKYGGRVDQRVSNGTGFFDIMQQEEGRWTFIDPDGYRFVSVGINSVGPNVKYEVYQAGFQNQFNNSHDVFAQKTFDLFQNLGINTLGSWSDDELFKDPDVRLPYTPRWNFLLTYKNIRPGGYINIYKEPIPVFEPEFEVFAMEHAQQISDYKDDPYVLGHFSDNEMPFHADNLLYRFLDLDETDPGHQAAQRWLDENEKTVEEVTNADHAAFCVVMVERYYSVVSHAIKTHDPNHLFLGSRVHGRVSSQDCSFVAASKYVDVISVNYYHRWGPEQATVDKWSQLSGLPLMITEWYAKGNDVLALGEDEILQLDNVAGAGFTVPSQRDRGDFYEHFTLNLLRNKKVVGWHWFRYSDWSSNTGLVSKDFIPYGSLADSMSSINSKVYALSDFLWNNTQETDLFMDGPQLA